MRGKYRKKREEKEAPKKRIWPYVLLGILLVYLIAAIIGTVVIFVRSTDMTLVESFMKFLEGTVIAIIILVWVLIAAIFIDIVGRITHFLLGDGFGDPGDGFIGVGGGGRGGGGGSFGGGGASR